MTYSAEIVAQPTKKQWRDFGELIEREQWGFFHWSTFNVMRKWPWCHTLVMVDYTDTVLGGVQYITPPDTGVAYVGSYIIAPEFRGRSTGKRLWNQMMENLGTDIPLILDSGGQMTHKYRTKSGFTFAYPHQIVRPTVSCAQLCEAIGRCIDEDLRSNILVKHIDPRKKNKDLLIYDQSVAGRDRSEFLREFMQISEWNGTYAIDLESVGPLYSEGLWIALIIMEKLLMEVPAEKMVTLHIPSFCEDFLKFLDSDVGCEKVERYDRSATMPYSDHFDLMRTFSFTGHPCQFDC